MVWRPHRSAGGRIGIGLTSALGLLGLVALLLGLTRQPGALALALLVLGLAALIAALVTGLWTYGYSTLRYALVPGAVVIRWLGAEDIVPLGAVDAVYSGQRLGRIRPPRVLTWPGYRVGSGRIDGREAAFFSTSDRPSDLTLLITQERSYLLSPMDGEAFRREIIRLIELEESSPPTPRGSRLRQLAALLRDPTDLALLGASLALAMAVLGLYMLAFQALPADVPLLFGPDGASLASLPRERLVQLPLLALGCWVASVLAGLALAWSYRGAARLLWSGNLAASAVILIALARLAS